MQYLCKVDWILNRIYLSFLTASIAGLCILPSSLFALTMVPSSLNKLNQEADWIVLATPIHKETIRVKHRLVTRYTIMPHAYLKAYNEPNQSSTRPSQLFFDFLGGTLNHLHQTVPGLISPPLNRPLLLFLKCSSSTQCRPLGWNQGTWVLSDPSRMPSPQQLLTEPYLFKPLLDQHDLHWIQPSSSEDSKEPSSTSSPSLALSETSTQLHTPLSRISPLSLSALALLLNQSWTKP